MWMTCLECWPKGGKGPWSSSITLLVWCVELIAMAATNELVPVEPVVAS